MPHSQSKVLHTGLIGSGIQLSSSPALHIDEARALGLQVDYELVDFDQIAGGATALARVLDDVQARGYVGVNVTFPVKQAVIPLLDELSREARALNAVNTVVFRNGKRYGYNTDWWGFAESFRRGLPGARLQRVALIGAGGAGAAVGYAAVELGTQELRIFDVEHERAHELAERLGALFPDRKFVATPSVDDAVRGSDGIIHATPVGMLKLPGLPVPAELLKPPLWVADIVYVPLETELLRIAARNGCRVLPGNGMAVFQAALAFELFIGRKPDAERMLAGFRSKAAVAAA
jgi:shikimate dehydrogenase